MQLKLNIEYKELLELIKQLPLQQLQQLKADLASIVKKEERKPKEKNDFQEFLLTGPVMKEEQYQEWLANRKYFNAWRTK